MFNECVSECVFQAVGLDKHVSPTTDYNQR